ncbi:unnamed protein product [Danaus chrysippus]|uniref:(African queen) hypothetical protein n=1 Tax=Danaus chrysippus TaxID=151541 RepID=A0A8J2VYI5_9NEOP|nr:unnamed protein product [Danaus chrysippus]
MNSPCFATSPYIFYQSDNSATETEDSVDSGCEKTVGPRTKYDSKRTINKVSEKILKVIERLTCNIGKVSKVKKSEKNKKGDIKSPLVPPQSPSQSTPQKNQRKRTSFVLLHVK